MKLLMKFLYCYTEYEATYLWPVAVVLVFSFDLIKERKLNNASLIFLNWQLKWDKG